MSKIEHRYYPVDLVIDNFVPPQYTVNQILVPFFSAVALLVAASVLLISGKKHNLSYSQVATKSIFVWFVLCGAIHTGLEGYFAFNALDIASQTNFLAECWKEYGLSDSRYMTADPAVWMIESITAFIWGPLCFYTAYLIYTDSPDRHLYQFGISFGQFYGDVLYYSTTLVEGAKHSRPEAFYFWFYFGF